MSLRQEGEGTLLAGMQSWMLNALLSPGRVDVSEVERHFVASPTLKATECLGLYQRGYRLRLIKCLVEQFPALCNALGERLFEKFAGQYLKEHPSDSYTLYELGRRFSDHLNNTRPDRNHADKEREGWIDFLVDLARYERLHFLLFDAPGHEGQPWPNPEVSDNRLVVQPCLELGSYRYPVAWYYQAIRGEPSVPIPPAAQSYVAVLRQDYRVCTYPINRVHYLFLTHLKECRDVNSALATVAQEVDRPLAEVKGSWQNEVRDRWIGAGFFVEGGGRGDGR